jgi:hypothetical protein
MRKRPRKRLDFYIQDALQEFAVWYVNEPNELPDWLGKERDCVNIFVTWFLADGVSQNAAVSDLRQIRVDCAVPQPKGYPKASATKDLVIWKDPLATTWDADWKPVNIPRAIIEWKTRRSSRPSGNFDAHDEKWLKAFTNEHPETIGFLVSNHATKAHRQCIWAPVRSGIVGKHHTVYR